MLMDGRDATDGERGIISHTAEGRGRQLKLMARSASSSAVRYGDRGASGAIQGEGLHDPAPHRISHREYSPISPLRARVGHGDGGADPAGGARPAAVRAAVQFVPSTQLADIWRARHKRPFGAFMKPGDHVAKN